jgi:hypothetical protein
MNMNDELSEKLRKSYPILYSQPIIFECGVGWFDLISRLSNTLSSILLRYVNEGADISLMYPIQIKEKYGTLRFYMSTSTDEMEEEIVKAELESGMICEVCGESGHLSALRGWYLTLCQECSRQAEIKLM